MQNQKEGWGKSESKRRSMEKRNVCLRKKLRKQFVQKKNYPVLELSLKSFYVLFHRFFNLKKN